MKRFDVEATRGRWPSILAELGVDDKTLSKRNAPCPFCGGKDRFRFTDHEGLGLWICNVCGTGNGIQFVERYAKVGFVGATKLIESVLPHSSATVATAKVPPRARLNKLWSMAAQLSADDPVGEYLLTRGVWVDEDLPELRFAESVPYFTEGVVSGHYHAMLARVRDGSGKPTTLHCTYLSGAGKANVPSPKKVMSAMGNGAAIRLFPAEPTLAIAEGIETALAVHLHTGYPVWSAISAGGMKSIVLPESVREVLIYADSDASFTGQAAAYALAQRMVSEGRRAEVFMPCLEGIDFADEGAW
jgi:putative DNA primase/helicase